jgi:hypothetical protein
MRNKCILCLLIFLCAFTSVFSSEKTEAERQEPLEVFLNDFYWYKKYLPLGDVSELHMVRNMVFSLQESAAETNVIHSSYMKNFEERISSLHERALKSIEEYVDENWIEGKLALLTERHGVNQEVQRAESDFAVFMRAVQANTFPENDDCLNAIEVLFSRLITAPMYTRTTPGRCTCPSVCQTHRVPDLGGYSPNDGLTAAGDTYRVVRGDYLVLIARRLWGPGYEAFWPCIYRLNIHNRLFLPNPANPNLIHPSTRGNFLIRIPPRPRDARCRDDGRRPIRRTCPCVE